MKIINKYGILALFLIISLSFFNIGKADDLSSDKGGDNTLTFASKRAIAQPVTLEKAKSQVKSDYSQIEVNLYSYDSTQSKVVKLNGLQNDMAVVSENQQFAVNVKSYNDDMYFYAYRVNGENEVQKLFPTNKDFYTQNPIQADTPYTMPNDENKWMTFGDEKGVEKFYFFVSKKRVSALESITSKRKLDKFAKKYAIKKSYFANIQEEREIKGKVSNPNMIWYKKIYASKIVVINNGDSDKHSKSLFNKAKKERIKEKVVYIK